MNIEDSNHCDFMALRNLVLAHHMQDLKEVKYHNMQGPYMQRKIHQCRCPPTFLLKVTHSLHYENFRCTKLQQMMSNLPPVRFS